MTDEQIIKALELCFSAGFKQCEECPLKSQQDEMFTCIKIKQKNVLDLINRQRADIEEFKTLCDMQDKIMLEQKAILEVINDEFNPLPFETDFDKAIKNAKSEVIKEFAEKLKSKATEHGVADCFGGEIYTVLYVSLKDIDDTLAEMTEPVKIEHNSLCETQTYIKG